jgi:hypothetical protein
MPQRLYRYQINNMTEHLTLVKLADHLCHGEWTGNLVPKQEIRPGENSWWQSESAGVMTGTEGWAKYDVQTEGGSIGMAYFYWDNPWFGYTHPPCHAAVSKGKNVKAPCGDDDTPGSSVFTVDNKDLPQFSFHTARFVHTEDGSDITGIGDLDAFALAFVNPWAAPVYYDIKGYGVEAIHKDPWAFVEFRDDRPKYEFQKPGTSTKSMMADASPADWEGAWRVDDITLQISETFRQLRVVLDDRTGSPLSLDVTVPFDSTPKVNFSHKALTGANDGHELVRGISVGNQIGRMWGDPALHRALEVEHRTRRPSKKLAIETERLASLADRLSPKHGFAGLGSGAALMLFGIYEDGRRVDREIRYQHMSTEGVPLVDMPLKSKPDVR